MPLSKGFTSKRESVQKFNPYHDERGRFTTGDQASSKDPIPPPARSEVGIRAESAQTVQEHQAAVTHHETMLKIYRNQVPVTNGRPDLTAPGARESARRARLHSLAAEAHRQAAENPSYQATNHANAYSVGANRGFLAKENTSELWLGGKAAVPPSEDEDPNEKYKEFLGDEKFEDLTSVEQMEVMEAWEMYSKDPRAAYGYDPATHIPDIAHWKQVGPQGGTNPGGVFSDEQGTHHYVKFPQTNPEQANAEKLADSIYRELGIPVKESRLVLKGNELGLAGKMLENSHEIGQAGVDASPDIKAGYLADAYLANWDVFGYSYDNILRSGGRDYRVDNGGSLFFRAQGETKAFPSDRVDELVSLIAPGKKGRTAFAGLSQEQIHTQAATLVTTLTNQRIADLVREAGLEGDRAKTYEDVLIGRRDVIARKFGLALKQELDALKVGCRRRKQRQGKFQRVPMDIAAIDAAMTKANS